MKYEFFGLTLTVRPRAMNMPSLTNRHVYSADEQCCDQAVGIGAKSQSSIIRNLAA